MADLRRARTRQRLLEAGHAVITEQGAAALRIADITARAGVAIGSFQNHFASKEELVGEVIRGAIERLAAEIVDPASPGATPAEVASAAIRRFVRLAYEDPDFCRLLVHLHHADELFLDAVRPFAQISLERGVRDGVFVVDDLDVSVTSIVAGGLAVIRRVLDGHVGPDADRALARAALLGFQVPLEEADRIVTLPLPPSRVTPQSTHQPPKPT